MGRTQDTLTGCSDIPQYSPHTFLDITWTSQGYRHFLLTGYNLVGLKYPAQDNSFYNDINNDSKM